MKKSSGFLILLFLSIVCFSQNKQNTFLLFNDKVSLVLTAELKQTQTTKGEKPDYLFQNKKSTAVLFITATDQIITDNDIPALADSFIIEIKRSAFFIDDGISLNDGKNISFIKYSSDSGEDKGFNYLVLGSMDNRLVMFSFRCAVNKKPNWEEQINNVVKTIRIKN